MNPLNRGLALHLPLDDIQNGQVIDVSGRGNNGTIHGAPQLIADDTFGRVIQFDGVNDYIDLGNPTDLQISGNQTIAMWLKRTVLKDTVRRNPFAKAFGGEGTVTQEPNGLFTYYYGIGGGNSEPYQDHISTTRPIADNTWTHIAVVRDFGQGKFCWYIDGTLQFEVATKFSSAKVSTLNGYVGQGYVNKYKGSMAHLRVYERALAEEEIRRDMLFDSARLILQLKFDDITENTVVDASGNGLNAIIQGDPKLIGDEVFGQSLALDGVDDYLTVPDNDLLRISFYTVAVWIKPGGPPGAEWKGIVGKPGRNYNLWLHSQGFIYHRFHVGSNTDAGAPNTQPGTILWDQWNHVAITNDGQTAKTYINGVLAASGPTGGPPVVDNTALLIGRNLDGNAGYYFKGQIANLRIYRGFLPATAIQRDIDQDRAARASFLHTHPLDFKLLNDDQQSVLLIDDNPAGHKAYLEITNTAHQALSLTGSGNVVPSSANHHFELRFRSGVLAQACLDIGQPERLVSLSGVGWQMSPPRLNGHTVSFYIVSTTDRTFAPGVSLTLLLNRLIADGGGGSRGTRLELHYQNLSYINEATPIEGSWVEQVDLVNHRGQKNIPLHVGFLGSNRVLNDQGKSESYLILEIGNMLPDNPIALLPAAQSSNPSQFVILFDHEPHRQAPWQKPWALGTGTDLKDVTVATSGITDISDLDLGDWQVEIEGQEGVSTEITLTPKTKKSLGPSEIVKVPLQKIRSSLPAGHANLYLRYQNIPGYWDGQFVVTVEKSPLVTRGDKVGIGTTSPADKLHIQQGNLRLENGYELFFTDNGQIRSLDNNHRILFRRAENKLELREYGDIIFSSGSASGQETARVVIDSRGNVGLGTKTPRTTLDTATGLMSGAANDYQKAQFTMSGGGIITWGGPGGRLKWTQRFIAISMERSQTFAAGHVNIRQPTANIPAQNVYDGQARSATAEGVILQSWEALYAVHTVGGNETQVDFRIVAYTAPFYAPSNWLLVAVVNGDDLSVKLGTGAIVTSQSQSEEGSELPLGAIIMWSGTHIPTGWALCNGQTVNGYTTPDLRGRFIVGYSPDDGNYGQPGDRSEGGSRNGNIGGAASVALSTGQMPSHNHTGSTSSAGQHHHWLEGMDADGLARRKRTIWGETTVDMAFGGGSDADPNDERWRGHVNTDDQGDHSHSFSTGSSGQGEAHENRPPYYVLAFIMKV